MKANQTYPAEFRAEVVKLLLEQGLTQPEAAERPGILKGSLSSWVVAAKRAGLPAVTGTPAVAELQAENARLRKELASAETVLQAGARSVSSTVHG